MKRLTIMAFIFCYLPLAQADLCLDLQMSERQVLEVQKEINKDTFFTVEEQKQILVYANHALSFNDIPFTSLTQFIDYLEGEGEFSFNEFNFMRIRLKSNGARFTYIWSYPGDNEYGIWINQNNEIVGAISDGDLSVGNNWCDYIDEE